MEAGIYNRQESMNLNVPDEMYILGTGGVGTWVAYNAVLMGVKTIHLYDEDRLDNSNLNRLPYSYFDVGLKKTSILKRNLIEFRKIDVIEHGFITDANEVDDMNGIIINSMDYPMKYSVQQKSSEKEIWTLGANDTRYSITDQPPMKNTWELNDVSQYTGICISTVMMLGAHTMGIISAGKRNITVSKDIREE